MVCAKPIVPAGPFQQRNGRNKRLRGDPLRRADKRAPLGTANQFIRGNQVLARKLLVGRRRFEGLQQMTEQPFGEAHFASKTAATDSELDDVPDRNCPVQVVKAMPILAEICNGRDSVSGKRLFGLLLRERHWLED
jgi:hypothetical protein